MSDIKTKQDYVEYEKSVADFIARENIYFLSTGCADILAEEWQPEAIAESWFSWHPCECCGSHLGGNREYLYALVKDTDTRVQYEICEDCVYYIEYGRLDDTTMARIEEPA